jgi:hypothetical protein
MPPLKRPILGQLAQHPVISGQFSLTVGKALSVSETSQLTTGLPLQDLRVNLCKFQTTGFWISSKVCNV